MRSARTPRHLAIFADGNRAHSLFGKAHIIADNDTPCREVETRGKCRRRRNDLDVTVAESLLDNLTLFAFHARMMEGCALSCAERQRLTHIGLGNLIQLLSDSFENGGIRQRLIRLVLLIQFILIAGSFAGIIAGIVMQPLKFLVVFLESLCHALCESFSIPSRIDKNKALTAFFDAVQTEICILVLCRQVNLSVILLEIDGIRVKNAFFEDNGAPVRRHVLGIEPPRERSRIADSGGKRDYLHVFVEIAQFCNHHLQSRAPVFGIDEMRLIYDEAGDKLHPSRIVP